MVICVCSNPIYCNNQIFLFGQSNCKPILQFVKMLHVATCYIKPGLCYRPLEMIRHEWWVRGTPETRFYTLEINKKNMEEQLKIFFWLFCAVCKASILVLVDQGEFPRGQWLFRPLIDSSRMFFESIYDFESLTIWIQHIVFIYSLIKCVGRVARLRT